MAAAIEGMVCGAGNYVTGQAPLGDSKYSHTLTLTLPKPLSSANTKCFVFINRGVTGVYQYFILTNGSTSLGVTSVTNTSYYIASIKYSATALTVTVSRPNGSPTQNCTVYALLCDI